jgi:hypothetical protein
VRTLHQGHLVGSVSRVSVVRRMGYANGLLRESRTAFEGMSISPYAAVVQDRLETLAAEEQGRQMGRKGLQSIQTIGRVLAQVMEILIRQWA